MTDINIAYKLLTPEYKPIPIPIRIHKRISKQCSSTTDYKCPKCKTSKHCYSFMNDGGSIYNCHKCYTSFSPKLTCKCHYGKRAYDYSIFNS